MSTTCWQRDIFHNKIIQNFGPVGVICVEACLPLYGFVSDIYYRNHVTGTRIVFTFENSCCDRDTFSEVTLSSSQQVSRYIDRRTVYRGYCVKECL